MLDKLKTDELLMPHGRIPRELLADIREIYNTDDEKEFAMELALAAIEYALCGSTSFDEERKDIVRALRPYTHQMDNNLDSYNLECETKVIEKKLDMIAKMYLVDRKTQAQIAAALSITQGEVSKRWKLIQRQYPELLEKYSK